ncbi:succinylglutamate desuccinylase/aspartoacylase family protein [Pseudophaeobacter leonis]|uniref:succinylglutamate desuccinylase/aspartoacylase family protein n=1 Tax=Pseudophaeobacter leonis TaxID=1144477 RepID=UPI001F4EB908|nr:succinylglutamate desuccinylase/aspartoacylase family protein [Pseudophaeobacter leonis]
MSNIPVVCEVDLAAEGKHQGYLRVPHSVHRSAYGWIGVPIVSIRNGEGPVMLMSAGVHGDEYEGQIALAQLVRELQAEDLRGQLILLPQANASAAAAGTRCSPIDNGNMNRLFPGNARGTPTEVIAHFIEEELLPRCGYSVDLHSGGSSLFYPPTLLRGQGHTPAVAAELKRLQAAFDAPYAWVFTGGGGPGSTARTLMGGANRKGVIPIMAELGGGGAVDPAILALTLRGLKRLLHSIGMLPDYTADAPQGTRELHSKGSVYAYDTGVFEPCKEIADPVTEGEAVGLLHRLDMPWLEPVPVLSPYNGMVLAKRVPGPVERGDAVVQVADDAG